MKPIFPAAQVVVDEPMEKGKENVSSANPVLSSCTWPMFGCIHPPPPLSPTSSASACKWLIRVSYARCPSRDLGMKKRQLTQQPEGKRGAWTIQKRDSTQHNLWIQLYIERISETLLILPCKHLFSTLPSPRNEHRSWEFRPGVFQLPGPYIADSTRLLILV